MNDTFAAEAAVMKFVEQLLGTIQFNRRADPRDDRTIYEYARNNVQTLRR